MNRLTDPDSGVTVSVDDEYAKELRSLGWKSPTSKASGDEPKKAPAKRAGAKSD